MADDETGRRRPLSVPRGDLRLGDILNPDTLYAGDDETLGAVCESISRYKGPYITVTWRVVATGETISNTFHEEDRVLLMRRGPMKDTEEKQMSAEKKYPTMAEAQKLLGFASLMVHVNAYVEGMDWAIAELRTTGHRVWGPDAVKIANWLERQRDVRAAELHRPLTEDESDTVEARLHEAAQPLKDAIADFDGEGFSARLYDSLGIKGPQKAEED